VSVLILTNNHYFSTGLFRVLSGFVNPSQIVVSDKKNRLSENSFPQVNAVILGCDTYSSYVNTVREAIRIHKKNPLVRIVFLNNNYWGLTRIFLPGCFYLDINKSLNELSNDISVILSKPISNTNNKCSLLDRLTNKELFVLILFSNGLSLNKIARVSKVEAKTISCYKFRIMYKLQLMKRSEFLFVCHLLSDPIFLNCL